MARGVMGLADLRIALFSGNYNMVRDGANQALNRLVGYLLRKGAAGLFADHCRTRVRADRRSDLNSLGRAAGAQ